MKQLNYIIFLIIIFLSSCNTNNSEKTKKNNIDKCPCDSIGNFNIKGKIVIEAYIGKSQLTISHYPKNDTMEITRFYTTDTKWHIQEYLTVVKNKIVDPIYSIYCDIKDTGSFYKLTYNMNDELERNPKLKFVNTIGTELILNSDTLRSKTTSILVPKVKLKGIIKIVKRSNVIYNGKSNIAAPFIFLDTDNLIKYGNLLEQYKAITKLCNTTNTLTKH